MKTAAFRARIAQRFDGGCNARSVGPCHGEVIVLELPAGSNAAMEARLCFRHLSQFHTTVGYALSLGSSVEPTPTSALLGLMTRVVRGL
jgi:hypothetical protein